MRSLVRTLFAFTMLGIVQLGATTAAEAQTTNVVVLGLTSLEGDDTFATNLSGALRQAASQVRGWTVSDRDVPLSQLELATGCDATELSCVQQIANTVGAQRLVYGTIQRQDAGGGRFDFAIRIQLYDTISNSILRTLDERLPSSRSDIDDLREPARRFATSLAAGAGMATTGGGGLPPEGEELGSGTGETGTETGSGETTPPPGGEQSSGGDDTISRLNWPAFALLLVAVGSAVGWIVTGLAAMEQRDSLDAYRNRVQDTMGGPICQTPGIMGDAQLMDACTNDTPMILQFVFLGVTAIAGGVGVGLLAANGVVSPEAEPSDRVRLRLSPSVGPSSAYLGVGFDF